ncbi:E3 ubiquitin-protein ligase Topors isoform X2 [Trichoplusia ni]|uniref:E3 ubiquitin-protein ligase Topors n=1 Tax=Trichoplusia ni TaxID=7111 RepID=A0A7E5WFZ9_TRINI|nr:E3 ubiquitin-protein ligase Topors isoform X2 [Trichoplusia ni]
MEALSTAQDDSSGANPSSVKSDDSSPCPDRATGSPPPNCAICLGTCKNKSFTDSCLHQFCFSCLLTWSKVKAECPLCKQAFRSIIHNVRSNHQYEEYLVVQRQTEAENTSRIDIDRVTAATHRTTFTLPRRETIAIQQLLRHYPFMADVFPTPAARAPVARRRRSPASFRRTVYRHNLWARPLPDFTGRYRDCTPDFYRYNETQMIRLMPWLNRELHYLLNENIGHIAYVMSRILDLLPQHHINSPEFREAMHRYFGDRTDHFLHELYCFASTPYDMTGYDRNVQYTTDSRISTMVNEVISSTDSDASVDSDIVMVSSSEPAEPPAGPSRLPAPAYPQSFIAQPSTNNSVIPIETISQSDTDDDSSEVMVVGYIKPPQDRTPEIVDLLGSDSDVIVQDNPQPETSERPLLETVEANRVAANTVKLTLKRHLSQASELADSDSDSDGSYQPPPPPRRRRVRSPAAPTTTDSARSTPAPSPAPTSSSSSDAADFSPSSTSTSTDEDTDNFKVNLNKRKYKKKSTKSSSSRSSRDRKKNKKRSSYHKEKKSSQTLEKDKRSKRKSHSGKGVKSSNKVRSNERSSAPTENVQPALDQPSTSGISGSSSKDERKASKERKRRRRDSRENKRLKSVVNVMYNNKNNEESNSSANFSNSSGTAATNNRSDVESVPGTPESRPRATQTDLSYSPVFPAGAGIRGKTESSSDSEDNLPLNLTLQKLSPFSSS